MNVIIAAITAIFMTLLSSNLIGGYRGMIVVVIFIVIFNLVEPLKRQNGLIVAGLCGFLWDLYSSGAYFGYFFVGLLIVSLIIKQVVKKMIQIPESI